MNKLLNEDDIYMYLYMTFNDDNETHAQCSMQSIKDNVDDIIAALRKRESK